MSDKNLNELRKLVALKDAELTVAPNIMLLLEAPKKNLELLNKIGLNSKFNEDLVIIQKINARREMSKLYESEVFIGDEIKKLCNKYDLKLIRVSHYKGNVSNEVAEAIYNFTHEEVDGVMVEKKNIDVNSSSFFILAPSEDFFTSNKRQRNFTIFYREYGSGDAGESEKFIKVCSWGSNYSFLRKYKFIYKYLSAESYKKEPYYVEEYVPLSIKNIILTFVFLMFFGVFTYHDMQYTNFIVSSVILLIFYLLNFQLTFNDSLWNTLETEQ